MDQPVETWEKPEAQRQRHPREEILTPFIERSISELINLFAQLFTTPFAVLTYSKQFQDQIRALADDDLETAYPDTVARPLSFFVLLMGAYCFLSSFHWNPTSSSIIDQIRLGSGGKATEVFKWIAMQIDSTPGAVIIIGFVFTLIIAVKSFFVSMTGRLLQCKVHFKTALYASAYAFGTFIFVLYIFQAIERLTAAGLGKFGVGLGSFLISYGSLGISTLLVVRVNQIIREVDATAELTTYTSWFIGTVIWHFVVVLCAIYIFGQGGIGDYWSVYGQFWQVFGNLFYPPGWIHSP